MKLFTISHIQFQEEKDRGQNRKAEALCPYPGRLHNIKKICSKCQGDLEFGKKKKKKNCPVFGLCHTDLPKLMFMSDNTNNKTVQVQV